MTSTTKYPTYAELGITEPEEGIIEFEMSVENVKLVRHLVIDPSGMPNKDKPFGSKYIHEDIQKILEHDPKQEIYRTDAYNYLLTQLPLVLQICLVTGKFKAAKFRADKYQMNWKEYKPKVPKKVKEEKNDEPDYAF